MFRHCAFYSYEVLDMRQGRLPGKDAGMDEFGISVHSECQHPWMKANPPPRLPKPPKR